jgi:hypothetical protein
MRNFLENEKTIRVMSSATGGTGTTASSIVDMVGFDSAAFIALAGAVTSSGTITMTVQGNDSTSTAGFADLEGANAQLGSDDDEGLLIVEVYRPAKRYLRAVVNCETANGEVDGILCLQRDPKLIPFGGQDDSVVDSAFVSSPDETA